MQITIKKYIIPEVNRFYGIIIALYYNEHYPPHFHTKYGEFQSEIEINTLQIIKGELPKRAKILALEWANEHRIELLQNWEFARQMKQLNTIEPYS